MKPSLSILGIRGIPASHGGFETFAERLSLHLQSQGWDVLVYCQADGGAGISEDSWRGIRRITVPVRNRGALGTAVFDWISVRHAVREGRLTLTLGYNTALFALWLRYGRVTNLINMDGIEWQRDKWPWPVKAWLRVNERLACLLGDHLIADNPNIESHLAIRVPRRKLTMIPYGADAVGAAAEQSVVAHRLTPGRYVTVIARPEPENSILPIVRAFSRKVRGYDLVVLGRYDPRAYRYQREVMSCASKEVKFLGAIYQKDVVQALRFHSALYVHGHQVGGTNPSLVEALGASCPVLAHDNRFNRWVAGDSARYFADEAECADQLDEILNSEDLRASMRAGSRRRFHEAFTWPDVLKQYEELLTRFAAAR